MKLRCVKQIMQKLASKGFIKFFLTYFQRIFSQNFSNRPYPNFKIILAYFYIIQIIYHSLPLRVLDTFLTFLRVLLAVNLLGCLDFSNKSCFLCAKLKIPFYNEPVLLGSIQTSENNKNFRRKVNLEQIIVNHVIRLE